MQSGSQKKKQTASYRAYGSDSAYASAYHFYPIARSMRSKLLTVPVRFRPNMRNVVIVKLLIMLAELQREK
jgi:hypothetical protein